MEILQETMLQLLRSELWGDPFEKALNTTEVEELLKLAREQTVFGLVFNALVSNQIKPDKNVLLKAFAIYNEICKRNEIVNRDMADFIRQMDDCQIDYLVVKGQTIAVMYPHPEVRMAGDVDFLVRDDYDVIREKFESCFNISLPAISKYEKEVSFYRNDILYELHTYLVTFGSSRNAKYWDALISKSWVENSYIEVQGAKIRSLPPTIYAIYVFLHLFFHFIREGVGLRQFCDWAVFLNYYHGQIDIKQLEEILKKLDMKLAYMAFGSIAVFFLGLPKEHFPFDLTEKDERWGRKIFEDVMKSGNFGKNNHNTKQIGLRFKLETAMVSLKHVVKYYLLAPRDLRNYLPRLIKGNIFMLFE